MKPVNVLILALTSWWWLLSSPALAEAPGQFTSPQIHRFRFFLHPDLVEGLPETEFKARLSLYVADLNAVFGKQTVQQFSFDPNNDITITNSAPYSAWFPQVIPVSGFEIWAWVQLSTNVDYGTYGGYAGADQSGAGVAYGLYWDAIHDPSTLVDAPADSPELMQYWRQIDHLTHETEHMFGAGMGEYYRMAEVSDTTGYLPTLGVSYSARETDPYWKRHSDFWNDPLLIGLPPMSYRDLTNTVRFANVTAAILNGPWRADWKATLPDTARTEIHLTDGSSDRPLPDARVRVWKVIANGQSESLLFFEGVTDEAGTVRFRWDPQANNYNMALLVKAYPVDGRPPAATWFSTFDAEEQKLVFGMTNCVISLPVAPLGEVAMAPTLVLQPKALAAEEGDSARLEAAVVGSAPLTFTWTLNGQEIAATTNGFLVVTNIQVSQQGAYAVTAANPFGSVTSAPAPVTVTGKAALIKCLNVVQATGPWGEDRGAMTSDSAGNLFWAINFTAGGAIGGVPVANRQCTVVVKLNVAGEVLWFRVLTGSAYSKSLAIGPNGDCSVAGEFSGSLAVERKTLTAQSQDLFLVTLDSEGNLKRAQRMGGFGMDVFGGLAVDAAGDCIITGTFVGSGSIGATTVAGVEGKSMLVLSKVSASGEPIWIQRSTLAQVAEGRGVCVDHAGNSYLTGAFNPVAEIGGLTVTNTQRALLLGKFDSSGQPVWLRETFDGVQIFCMTVDAADSLYVGGLSAQGSLVVAKLSAEGDPIWSSLGRGNMNSYANAIQVEADGDVFVAGSNHSTPLALGNFSLANQGSEDGIVARLNPAGEFVWATSFGGPGSDRATGLSLGPQGVVYALGSFEDSAQLEAIHLSSGGYSDAFVAVFGTRLPPAPPVLALSVTNLVLMSGASFSVTVSAKGTKPFTYQWRKDGIAVENATNAVIELANPQPVDSGKYTVVAQNAAGGVESAPVLIRVSPKPSLSIQSRNSGKLAIAVPTCLGLTYVIEYADQLESPAWQTLRQIDGTDHTVTFEAPTATSKRRFYRVRVP